MFAVKGCQDAIGDVCKGSFSRMVFLIARLIEFSKGMFIEIANNLAGYNTFKEFGNVRQVGNGMVIGKNFSVWIWFLEEGFELGTLKVVGNNSRLG